jgi:hypothetical protein
MARSTSAPPKSVKPASTRNVTTRTKPATATVKPAGERAPVGDDRIKRLQDQMTGIEQARQADTARSTFAHHFTPRNYNTYVVTADMDAERLKGVSTTLILRSN